jgi:hypothetical protein
MTKSSCQWPVVSCQQEQIPRCARDDKQQLSVAVASCQEIRSFDSGGLAPPPFRMTKNSCQWPAKAENRQLLFAVAGGKLKHVASIVQLPLCLTPPELPLHRQVPASGILLVADSRAGVKHDRVRQRLGEESAGGRPFCNEPAHERC